MSTNHDYTNYYKKSHQTTRLNKLQFIVNNSEIGGLLAWAIIVWTVRARVFLYTISVQQLFADERMKSCHPPHTT